MQTLQLPIQKAAGMPRMPKPKAPGKMGGISKVPANAIPLGKNQMPPGRGQVVNGPHGGRYYIPAPGEAPQQPRAATTGQPQQMPGQVPQQLPGQQPQQMPEQLTEEKVKELYPKLPRPDLVKVVLPSNMSLYDMKDMYTEILSMKNNLLKIKDQLEEVSPGRFDKLNSMANKLLEGMDNNFGVENIMSVGKPSHIKTESPTQKMKHEMTDFTTKEKYQQMQEKQSQMKEKEQAEATYNLDNKDVSNIKTPAFKFTPSKTTIKTKNQKIKTKTEINDIASKVNELFKVRGLNTKVVKMPKTGDFGYRFTVKIDKRDILNRRLGRLLGVVERDISAYTNKDLKIKRDGSNLIIDMPAKKSAFVDFSSQYNELSPEDKKKPVVSLGKTIEGDNFNIDMGKATHWLITGSTGSGKSVMQNNIIGSLATKSPKDVRMILIDPKQGDEFNKWGNLPHLMGKVATTPALGLAAIKKALDVTKQRQDILAQSGDKKLSDYNEKNPNKKLPDVYVFVDEFKEMLEMVGDKEFKKLVDRIAATGRSSGVHLVLGTQYGDAQTLSSRLINNLPNRAMFSMPADIVAKNPFLKESGIDKLGEPGNFAVRTQDSSQTIKGRSPFISDQNIDEITNSWGNKQTTILPKEKTTKVPTQKG